MTLRKKRRLSTITFSTTANHRHYHHRKLSSPSIMMILVVMMLVIHQQLVSGIPVTQKNTQHVPIGLLHKGQLQQQQPQELASSSLRIQSAIASSFSASFLVRDRMMKNREIMNGVINVNNVLRWEETEAMIHYFDDQDESSDKTLYLYHGLLAMKHHEKLMTTRDDSAEMTMDPFTKSVIQMEHDHQEWQCVDDESDIPPLEHLFQSLAHMKLVYQPPLRTTPTLSDHGIFATPVYDREVQVCIKQNLTLFSINFSGQSYVLCMSRDESQMDTPSQGMVVLKPERLIGKEFLIDVLTYSPQRMVNWLSEKTRDVVQKKCSLSRNSHMRPKLSRKKKKSSSDDRSSLESDDESWFNSYHDTCRYEWMRDGQSCQKFEASNTPLLTQQSKQQKICIFLHGAGNDPADAGPPVHSYPEYWGYVEHYTPQCSERWFIREDTKTKGWDSEQLQRAYCSLALINQTEGDTVIRNKIIFAHSMGNVILADAIQNGICSIDVKTTSWYETQGALLGSKAAHTIRNICRLANNEDWIRHLHPLLMKWVITKAGYCIPGTNLSYPVYDTLDPSFEKLKGMADIARKYVKGALCGNSAFGLTTMYSLPLSYFSQYTSYEEDNDAIVPLTSCDEVYQRYSDKPSSQFYSAGVNHADGTCRNGNGWWGRTRKPCSWYTDKF